MASKEADQPAQERKEKRRYTKRPRWTIYSTEKRAQIAQQWPYKYTQVDNDQWFYKLAPGSSQRQYEFLCDAAEADVFDNLYQENEEAYDYMISYFSQNFSYEDIAARRDEARANQVRELVTSGIEILRRELYNKRPDLAQADIYPLEELIKEKEKQRRAAKGRSSTDVFVAKKDTE